MKLFRLFDPMARMGGIGYGWYLIVAIAVLSVPARVQLTPFHDDFALLIHFAREWLAGARLYIDIIEINAPTVIFLYIPSVFLNDWLGLSYEAATFSFATLAILMSLFLSRQSILILSRSTGEATFFVWMFVLFNLFFLGDVFAQKNHYFFLFVFPFICRCALPDLGAKEHLFGAAVILEVCFFGLGISIKPHFLLLFIPLLILYRFVAPSQRRRYVHMLLLAVFATVMAYVITFTLAPGFISLSLAFTSKFYLIQANFPYMGVVPVMVGVVPLLIVIPLFLKFFFKLSPTDYFTHFDFLLFAMGVVVAIVYVAQLQGYPYQFLAAELFFFLLVVRIVGYVGLHCDAAFLKWVFFGLLAVIIVNGSLTVNYRAGLNPWRPVHPITPFLQAETESRSILLISRRFQPAMTAAILNGHTWKLRYASLWMLNMIDAQRFAARKRNDARRIKELDDLQQLIRDHTIEDFKKTKPDFVICAHDTQQERARQFCRDLRYFSGVPEFQELLKNYRLRVKEKYMTIFERVKP